LYSIILLNFGPVILCCKKDYNRTENLPNIGDCHCMFCPTKYTIKYIVSDIWRQIQNVLKSLAKLKAENNS